MIRTHLGRHRWVVERTILWVLRFKRLGLRYDRTGATPLPLLLLAVTLIDLRRLRQATKPGDQVHVVLPCINRLLGPSEGIREVPRRPSSGAMGRVAQGLVTGFQDGVLLPSWSKSDVIRRTAHE